jgi:predicted GNAT family acetyltransferase
MPADSRAGEELRHEPASHRFTLSSDGALAILDYRVLDATTLEYHHTYTPRALRGRGIASRLVAYALRHALDHGLKVVPACPFVAAFIRKNPEFAPAVRR